MDQDPKLRPARPDDCDFAWKLYSQAVKPHIGPYIAAHFDREWSDDEEKARFLTWWTPENTSIVTVGETGVGWLHFEETDAEITLLNYCVADEFRHRGIGSKVIGLLLENWQDMEKPIHHSVLKDSQYRGFFELFGFEMIEEDEITFLMRRPAAAMAQPAVG
jgi:N-acetylglutamate synthase-like GNAT family acetyltransferase